jgi:hypothetical protein
VIVQLDAPPFVHVIVFVFVMIAPLDVPVADPQVTVSGVDPVPASAVPFTVAVGALMVRWHFSPVRVAT